MVPELAGDRGVTLGECVSWWCVCCFVGSNSGLQRRIQETLGFQRTSRALAVEPYRLGFMVNSSHLQLLLCN